MEAAIGEAQNGFALHWLPCGEFLVNAAYSQIARSIQGFVEDFGFLTLP